GREGRRPGPSQARDREDPGHSGPAGRRPRLPPGPPGRARRAHGGGPPRSPRLPGRPPRGAAAERGDRVDSEHDGSRALGHLALMRPAFAYHRPSTVEEACRILAREPGAAVLAGGTDLM